MLGSTTSGIRPRHWLEAGSVAAVLTAVGWLGLGHVTDLADRTAAVTASRVVTALVPDAVATRPLVALNPTVTLGPGDWITVAEEVQVRENCDGAMIERRAVWPDGHSETVEPMAGSAEWRGSIFANTLGPGTHRVWVRYMWPPDARPVLYFVRADFRHATCPSGYHGEYLVLYRELAAG